MGALNSKVFRHLGWPAAGNRLGTALTMIIDGQEGSPGSVARLLPQNLVHALFWTVIPHVVSQGHDVQVELA